MYVEKKLNQEVPRWKPKYEAEYNEVRKLIESDNDNIVLIYETAYDARLVYSRLYCWALKHNLPVDVHYRDKTKVIIEKVKGA